MSQYVVSARKYRPQRFEEVVGQEQVTKTLKNALKSKQLAQSFLFCGPRGVGKTTCARILAKAINCENASEDMEPCNTCSSCVSFNSNASFNIHELDAASNNSVDDMRSLTDQVRFAPQAGKYKVYIIDEVHMLSQAAFNAFLKTLEEPPPYAVFILATTEKHKIIPTILSRCQIFDFKRILVNDIVKHLQHICAQENITSEEAGLHVIAQKADGALRDALSIFDKIASSSNGSISYANVIQNLNILDYEYFFKVTDQLLVEDSASVLLAFDDVVSKGFEGDTFILGLAEHFRNLLMCKEVATLPLLEVSDDIAEKYKTQAQITQSSFLLNALDIASKCDAGYKMARNKRLHVELALLKICFLNRLLEVSPSISMESKKKQPLATKQPPIESDPKAKEVEQPIQQTSTAAPQVKEETSKVVQPDEPKQQKDSIKETTPSTASGSLFSELNKALKDGQFNVDEVNELEEAIELNEELILKAWEELLEDDDLPSNFVSHAKPLVPKLMDEQTIVLTVFSNVSKGFITQQGSNIKSHFREYFNRNDLQLKIDIEIDETVQEEDVEPTHPKELFEHMAKENPTLIDFQKRFDLDIDYDN